MKTYIDHGNILQVNNSAVPKDPDNRDFQRVTAEVTAGEAELKPFAKTDEQVVKEKQAEFSVTAEQKAEALWQQFIEGDKSKSDQLKTDIAAAQAAADEVINDPTRPKQAQPMDPKGIQSAQATP